jgi:hypothetical protein
MDFLKKKGVARQHRERNGMAPIRLRKAIKTLSGPLKNNISLPSLSTLVTAPKMFSFGISPSAL